MKKIYGNKEVLSTLENMMITGRTANSLIFYGEKGSGRKLIADYYTSQLLCENTTDGKPCGVCNSCRNVMAGHHPDVVYVETSGKLESYSVDTARSVRADAYIKPNNNTGRKVYIFRDCQRMRSETQNALLKIIEEPPEYAYFIFTAESKYEFLPTIISRCICFGVSPCTEEEAELSLSESGFTKDEITRAVNCFHGNIGMCTGYITDDKLREKVDLTKSLAESIIRRDEYGLNALLYSVGSDRKDIYNVLSMTDKIIRDAVVLSKDRNARIIGCFREGAVRLSAMITVYQGAMIHKAIEKTWKSIESNVSAPLVLASLCADIVEIIGI